MGCKCKKGQTFTEEQKLGLEELPDHDLKNEKDTLIRFEKMLPLYKTHIGLWMKKLQEVGKDEIQIEEMKGLFDLPSFKGVFEKGEPLYQVLCNLPDCSEDKLKVRALEVLGIAWCSGSDEDKAEALFSSVNPPGQSQVGVGANDKELPEVIEYIIDIHTHYAL